MTPVDMAMPKAEFTEASAEYGNGQNWTRIGIVTLLLCALAGGVDSFDTQMIGFTGRQIADDLGFPIAHLGWLFGAGQLGGMAGAFLFGTLADRFGRSRMLIVASLMAACFTAASLGSGTYGQLLICRVLGGLGLGGMMPCFLGLGVEAMPQKHRLTMTSVLYASFPAGGVAGAWISAPLVTAYGWRGVFALAAGLLVLIAALLLVLPIGKGGMTTRPGPGPIASLWSSSLRDVTLWITALFLLAPTGVYLLVMWMPPLLQLLGVSVAHASLLVGFVNLGALVLALAGGWFMHRLGRLVVMIPVLIIGASSFVVLAAVHTSFFALISVSTVAGAALGGGMALLVSMVANAYPAPLRATGIGWAMGIARIGQMSAPIPIGFLLGAGMPPQLALSLCGVTVCAALVPLVLVDRAIRRRETKLDPPATILSAA